MNRHKIHFYFHAAATAQSQVMKMIDVHLHAAYRMTGSKRGREKQRKTGRMAAITLLNMCVCVCVWGVYRPSANRHKVKCREQLKAKWVNQVKVNCGTGNVKVPPIVSRCSEPPKPPTDLKGPFQLSFSVAQSSHNATKEHMLHTLPKTPYHTCTFLRPQNVSLLLSVSRLFLSFFVFFSC